MSHLCNSGWLILNLLGGSIECPGLGCHVELACLPTFLCLESPRRAGQLIGLQREHMGMLIVALRFGLQFGLTLALSSYIIVYCAQLCDEIEKGRDISQLNMKRITHASACGYSTKMITKRYGSCFHRPCAMLQLRPGEQPFLFVTLDTVPCAAHNTYQ